MRGEEDEVEERGDRKIKMKPLPLMNADKR
jgi:hypothetical protein